MNGWQLTDSFLACVARPQGGGPVSVKVEYQDQPIGAPTPINNLQVESPPTNQPHCVAATGVSSTPPAGGKKHELELQGLAMQSRAYGDLWGALGPNQCHRHDREGKGNQNGQQHSINSDAVVWRNPVVFPSDIATWDAIPLPKDARHMPRNDVMCIMTGAGILDLGDGDLDGDKAVVTADISCCGKRHAFQQVWRLLLVYIHI